MECAEFAERTGSTRHVIPVDASGRLDPDALARALASGLSVLSVLWVNNETGMILAVDELQELVRASGAVLHVDGVQAIGKISVDLRITPLDVLVLTGHKLGGPTGTGAIVLRAGVRLQPLLHGGKQEGGLRPGTEDVAGAVGLAAAVDLAVRGQPHAAMHMEDLRNHLEDALTRSCPDLTIHCKQARRAPHISNLGFPGVPRDVLLAGLDLECVAVSGGSACSSGSVTQSRVIKALYGEDYQAAAVRFSLAPSTRQSEVDIAVERTQAVLVRFDHEKYGMAAAKDSPT